jgi:TatD DNase family protein
MLVDSHCHLQDPKYSEDLSAVLDRAAGAGVETMVVVGYDVESSREAVALADRYAGLYATVGVHPHDARTFGPSALKALEELANSPAVVGIGETGLDLFRNLSPLEHQERALRDQLQLARRLKLPVVIHSREADDEVYEVLAEYAATARDAWGEQRPLGMMHCFAGDLSLAKRYIDLGFVVSISGVVTYPNADRTKEVAAGIPLSWMTIETDAPYLPPQDIRGKRNEPARVKDVAAFVAQLRDEEMGTVMAATAQTAARLFGWNDEHPGAAPTCP